MNRAIHIEYESCGKKGQKKFWCSGPLSAISGFHYYMQDKLKKKPGEYRMARIYDHYVGGDGLWHASDFDLPGGPNPDVNKTEQKPAEQTELFS
jgi:hypothetical protein